MAKRAREGGEALSGLDGPQQEDALAGRLKRLRSSSQRDQPLQRLPQHNGTPSKRSQPAPRATGVDDLLANRGYGAYQPSERAVDSATAARLASARTAPPSDSPASAQPAQPPRGTTFERSSLPVDWSLKTSVRIFTSSPPPSLACPLAEQQAHALDCLSSKAIQLSDSNTRAQRALLSCLHPQDKWSNALVRAAKASDASLWHERVKRWRQAFSSAFFNLRSGRSDMLYCVFHQQFVVLFCAPGIRGENEPTATLSRSTRALRGMLERWAIRFTRPQQQRHSHDRQSGGLDDPSSLLRVEGACNVHLLFSCLRATFTDNENRDIPTLLAPTSFLHGAMCPTTMRYRRRQLPSSTSITATAAAFDDRDQQADDAERDGEREQGRNVNDGQEQPQKVHSVEIEGMVPPWVVLRTVTIFKELFRSFEMDARSMPTSVGLNCTGEENRGRGGHKTLGHNERELLHEPSQFERGELSHAKCRSGRFELTISEN